MLHCLERPSLAVTHWSRSLSEALQRPVSASELRLVYLRSLLPLAGLGILAQCAGVGWPSLSLGRLGG